MQNEHGQPIGDALRGWTAPARPARVTLNGHWCQLQPLNVEAHADALHTANLADHAGSSWTYLPYGPFATVDAHRAWVSAMGKGDDPLFFAIIDKSDGQPAGVASYLRITPESGSIEVGHLHYAPRLQRTAAATETMFLMMRYAFDLGYRRYEWKCDALNAPSRVAALRLGFQYEGIFRQATVYRNRNRDTAWFAIIDRDWPALRERYEAWLLPENFDEHVRQIARLSP